MSKIFLLPLVFAALITASPALAKINDNPFVAAIINIVQDIMPSEEKAVPQEEFNEEFVDPREVQQVLREFKDIRRELNRFIKELKKLANTQEDISQINTILEQVNSFETKIKAEESLRETIQEFRDAQIWDEVQKFRAKVEIPKEITQWNKEIKRVEKLLAQKKIRNLTTEFGIEIEKVKTKLDETKAGISQVQGYYNAGDLESAIEEFDTLRQDFHPGELNSVLQRFQDLLNRLKSVRDKEIKNQIKETLNEVVGNFNEGEYRIARELMDENFNELTKVIYQGSLVGQKKGYSKEGWMQIIEKFEVKIQERGEEKREQEQRKMKPEEAPQALPVQPAKPPAEPIQPSSTSAGTSLPATPEITVPSPSQPTP